MAEKFSKFRDPGTGIQVFLTPVAASTSGGVGAVSLVLVPLFVVLGLVRALVAGMFWGLYLASGTGWVLRVVLGALGYVRLNVETVRPAARGRAKPTVTGTTTAGKGDVVLSNHSSWVDLLLLAYLYPGITFAMPVISDAAKDTSKPDTAATAGRRTPKKNAMSANTRIVTPTSSSSDTSSATEIPLEGYTLLSLTSALRFVGGLPPSPSQLPNHPLYDSLDALLKTSPGPVALFPEVVTSNNRALLNMSLPSSPPSAMRTTHIVTIKYTPPTATSTTAVYSAPSPANSVARHLVDVLLLSSPVRGVAIRQSTVGRDTQSDNWAEEVAGTMSTMARLKRTSIQWWAKKEFLTMVGARNRRV